ncbi:hypothetical protein CEUSTIGMA_g2041.t1 [Chlamydomonas eustigma]|uniref:DNA helicase n=1 Tax=Chlamydomonas eustigma TaxID=1157962 RepID=A0A250WUS5_9CHLO|nr:hypothetical protein CEUSTIGMA_g2041.t1 [Chlamydomonas eustigma]|eukprot:GAX74593.1 hypothetical protein CEUSTIGMA_g2041.t1 [Chlamydomonas eustigma]
MATQLLSQAVCFIFKYYTQDVHNLLLSSDFDSHHGFTVNFLMLADSQIKLAEALMKIPIQTLQILDEALLKVQDIVKQRAVAEQHVNHKSMEIKSLAHVRLLKLPWDLMHPTPHMGRPAIGAIASYHMNKLISVSGTVTRAGSVKMYEYCKLFECSRCHLRLHVRCRLDEGGAVNLPETCPRADKPCTGNKFKQVTDESPLFTGHQEVRLQEKSQCLAMATMPASIIAVLQDELADSIRPGEDVVLTGVIVPRWEGFKSAERCCAELVLLVNNVEIISKGKDTEEEVPQVLKDMFEDFWTRQLDYPLRARNRIVAAVCPQLHGLFLLKLAVLLMLEGGVERASDVSGGASKLRGSIHMLLIGDPGLGKSQIMKFASRVSGRSVVTTGKGSSGAGLTVTAVKDSGGAWVLEAGALVLADGGLCCIDEFDGIRDADRAMLHEAMEQQTLHVAKAGMVTTLSTRTSVLAATNPRKGWTCSKPLAEATNLSGPLLSRFDVILVMTDIRNPLRDQAISQHVLHSQQQKKESTVPSNASVSTPSTSFSSLGPSIAPSGWTIDVLRHYVTWTKQYFKPAMSEAAEVVISAYFQVLRNSDHQCASRTTIRMLESLVRISQAHAKLMARHTVTQQDAVMAVLMVETSQNCLMVIGTDYAVQTSFPADPDAEQEVISRRILQALGLTIQSPLALPAPSRRQLPEQSKEDVPPQKSLASRPSTHDALSIPARSTRSNSDASTSSQALKIFNSFREGSSNNHVSSRDGPAISGPAMHASHNASRHWQELAAQAPSCSGSNPPLFRLGHCSNMGSFSSEPHSESQMRVSGQPRPLVSLEPKSFRLSSLNRDSLCPNVKASGAHLKPWERSALREGNLAMSCKGSGSSDRTVCHSLSPFRHASTLILESNDQKENAGMKMRKPRHPAFLVNVFDTFDVVDLSDDASLS